MVKTKRTDNSTTRAVRELALRTLSTGSHQLKEQQRIFDDRIIGARRAGCTLAEIAEAAGMGDHTTALRKIRAIQGQRRQP